MNEKFEQPSFNDLRIEETKNILGNLTNKRPIQNDSVVTLLAGPHSMVGLKVIEIDGAHARLSPSPESTETIQVDISELYDVADVADAYQQAVKKYPFTNEELGISDDDWPKAMLN